MLRPRRSTPPRYSHAQALESRRLLAATPVLEIESNDTPATAMTVDVDGTGTVVRGGELVRYFGSNPPRDVDYYRFTLGQRAGVFLDVDARDGRFNPSGYADARITLFAADGVTPIASNDTGDDFESFLLSAIERRAQGDPALYADLAAGTYVVRIDASPAAAATGGDAGRARPTRFTWTSTAARGTTRGAAT
jgi:hypothetical protein